MKEIKQNLNSLGQLVEARAEQMRDFPVGVLRSHGKLLGMDVFSWNKPDLYELENTLSSFPSPVSWFANETDVLKLLSEDQSWLSNVKLICTYDKAGFSISNKLMDTIDSVLGAKSLNDALELMKPLAKKQGILLFTTSGENWKQSINTFENFLNELRTQK